MAQRSIWLNELTWEDVRDYLKDKDIIIVPLRSHRTARPGRPSWTRRLRGDCPG